MTWMYRRATAVNKHGILTADRVVQNMAQKLCEKPLVLYYFAERLTEVLKEGYTILE